MTTDTSNDLMADIRDEEPVGEDQDGMETPAANSAPQRPGQRNRATRLMVNLGFGVALSLALFLGLSFAPTLAGHESLIVTSGSMGSAMPAGSVAITRSVPVASVGIGDIVTYRHPGETIPTTHRVTDVEQDAGARIFTTKGDANPVEDRRPARVSDEIHVVERVVPYAGWLIQFVRSLPGTVLFLLIPVLGLVLTRNGQPRDDRQSEVPA